MAAEAGSTESLQSAGSKLVLLPWNLIWHLGEFYYFRMRLLPNLTLGKPDFLPFKLTYEASQDSDLEGAKATFSSLPLSLNVLS